MTKFVTIQMDDKQKLELGEIPIYNADEMLGQNDTVHLVLGTKIYILRKTRQNKLLLTK